MQYNSLSAYRELKDKRSRQQAVLSVYLDTAAPLTDRQVRDCLGLKEMNDVRPRISELVDEGDLTVLDLGVKDETTNRKVRLCRVSTPEEKRAVQERKCKYQEDYKSIHKPIQMTLAGTGSNRVTNSHLAA